ncbi:hypothetical protein GCM10025734_75100 [Kitasatospora paranensis]
MDRDGTPSERSPAAADRHPPPLDPELSAALRALGGEAGEPVTPENLAARQERDAAARPRPTIRDLRADGRFEVEELRVPGVPGAPDGREVTLVHARPAAATGPLPLLYYLHGGGMIMGNARSVLPRLLREWALPLRLAVVSVEYRLAPQVQYPGPVEDCWAGLVHVADRAADLGLDADRVVVGGRAPAVDSPRRPPW